MLSCRCLNGNRNDCPNLRDHLSIRSMNHLRKIGLASFLFLGLGKLAGSLPGSVTSWTPQTAATIALVCYCAGLVLALIAFMQSRRGQSPDGVTKFLARGPL